MSELANNADRIYAQFGLSPEAINELENLIHSNETVAREAIHLAAYDMLLGAQRRTRNQIERQKPVKTYSPEFQERVQRACKGWYAWPMMDGTPLGKATKVQLERDAERYERNARGNKRKAKFLFAVAAKVADGQRVEDALTEEEIAKLMK